MRDHIINEIRWLAKENGGQGPGVTVFARETGINDSTWLGKFWARWRDALSEAGLAPNDWNGRLNSADVLTKVVAACRHYCRVPTKAESAFKKRKFQ